MIIERPPSFFRALFPGGVFRVGGERQVMLTFDDGPIPEATPEILDILDRYGIKATFFMVGDNVRKHPDVFEEVCRRGHCIGNHSMHHLQGIRTTTGRYLDDIGMAARLIPSPLYRPPHGILRPRQLRRLRREYDLVMYDLITRDYSRRVTAADVLDNVKRYTRPGSIIVFHDSLRSIGKLRAVLPAAIEWLRDSGYTFVTPRSGDPHVRRLFPRFHAQECDGADRK